MLVDSLNRTLTTGQGRAWLVVNSRVEKYNRRYEILDACRGNETSVLWSIVESALRMERIREQGGEECRMPG